MTYYVNTGAASILTIAVGFLLHYLTRRVPGTPAILLARATTLIWLACSSLVTAAWISTAITDSFNGFADFTQTVISPLGRVAAAVSLFTIVLHRRRQLHEELRILKQETRL